MKKKFIFTLLIFYVIPMSPFADTDCIDKECERRVELSQAERLYEIAMGAKPTPAAVLNSLKISNASGDRGTELIAALDLIANGFLKDQVTTEMLMKVHENNPSNQPVRLGAARALLEINVQAGKDVLKTMVGERDRDVATRLGAAVYLFNAGELSGFAIMDDALSSKDAVVQRDAIGLLERFAAHDGKIVPGTQQKVDVLGVIDKAGAHIGKSELRNEMDAIARKVGKGKAPPSPRQ